jgi:hypothetical protein
MKANHKTLTLSPSLMGFADEVILAPIGDLQYGAAGADLDKFKRHIDWCYEHHAYMLGMGDFVDVASPSGQKKIVFADFYESILTVLSEDARRNIEVLMSILRGTEELWLGLHEGHHFWNFGTDYAGNRYTTDSVLADMLGCPFLDWSAITTLSFEGSDMVAKIHSTHGNASSTTMYGPLGKLEKRSESYPEVDIFLEGHCARKAGYPRDPLIERDGQVKAVRRIFALTGGFCKGYLMDSTTYVEKAQMQPLNLGAPLIFIRPIDAEGRLDMNLSL